MNVLMPKPSGVKRRLRDPLSDITKGPAMVRHNVNQRSSHSTQSKLADDTRQDYTLVFASVVKRFSDRRGNHFKGGFHTQCSNVFEHGKRADEALLLLTIEAT